MSAQEKDTSEREHILLLKLHFEGIGFSEILKNYRPEPFTPEERDYILLLYRQGFNLTLDVDPPRSRWISGWGTKL